MVTSARRWGPVAGFVAVAVAVQHAVLGVRYDVAGHAADHLGSASAPFFAFAVVATLVYVTPGARWRPGVLAACLAWFTMAVLVLVGNVQVVDALIDAGLHRVPTDELVVTGLVAEAHQLADAAPWYGVLASLAVAAAMWRARLVSGRLAVGAAVTSVVFPPWIVPGAGMVVLVAARALKWRHESLAANKDAAARLREIG